MPEKANPALSLGVNPVLIKIILKEEMKKRNWTNYRLSKESGVPQSTVSDHFSEDKEVIPSNDSIGKYCSALGISVVDLVIKATSYRSKEGEMLPLLWERIEKISKRGQIELISVCDRIINKEERQRAHGIYEDEDEE